MIYLYALVFAFCFSSCTRTPDTTGQDPLIVELRGHVQDKQLANVNIIDRHGMSETISAKDRLKTLEETDYLGSQAYQKVLRVYARDKNGKILSIITSYYPTGQLKQYLEVINGRANGSYVEWHINGKKKLQATVLGGNADIDEKSIAGWAFDKQSYCWNDEGILIAEMTYEKGLLEGKAYYYHANGKPSEIVPYHKGEIEGEVVVYNQENRVIEKTNYSRSNKEGQSLGFWPSSKTAWIEDWHKDLLQDGLYFNEQGTEICKVVEGNGKRAILIEDYVSELQEYKEGKPEGEVVIFDDAGIISSRLHIKNGKKHGDEIVYWKAQTRDEPLKPKLSIEWYQGKMQGLVKTWFEDGTQESQREMSHNTKQGVLMAWYRDGQLMLIEEYEKDRLKRGDYLKKGDTKPVSKINDGKGVATFYDADGTFLNRVEYKDGKPVDDALTG